MNNKDIFLNVPLSYIKYFRLKKETKDVSQVIHTDMILYVLRKVIAKKKNRKKEFIRRKVKRHCSYVYMI